jgi:hypothetical protein
VDTIVKRYEVSDISDIYKYLKYIAFGAGEGIRTLDPNLGNDRASVFRRLLKYAPVRFITAFPIFMCDRARLATL